jgi:prepilin-type N-terminal cleavage/methylation domain-containing protein
MNALPLVPSANTMWRRHSRPDRSRSGFTMLELVVVLGIVCVLGAMAAMLTPQALKTSKADSGMIRVVSALRTAREQAISQRRNVRVAFTAPNQIVVSRVEVPSGTLTAITTVWIEDGVRFLQFAGVPDTPDGFGNGSATSFGTATSVAFTSEGQLIDQHGDPINGTVFLASYNDPTSGRAVTIFGPTALLRQWRWNGHQWMS